MPGKTNYSKLRTAEAFKETPSLHPLVVGHMCKQDKNRYTFSKRYFALYESGLLVYYNHERDFEEDVQKHQGVPLHSTLVKLDGMFLSRPKTPYAYGIKHCFTLHAPEKSNHRDEFLLVCQRKKDMHIWMEQLQSQNTELARKDKLHKTPSYIMRMKLQTLPKSCSSQSRQETCSETCSVSELDSSWLKQTSYCPGEIALRFHPHSPISSYDITN